MQRAARAEGGHDGAGDVDEIVTHDDLVARHHVDDRKDECLSGRGKGIDVGLGLRHCGERILEPGESGKE
jgi:hypothetical protein